MRLPILGGLFTTIRFKKNNKIEQIEKFRKSLNGANYSTNFAVDTLLIFVFALAQYPLHCISRIVINFGLFSETENFESIVWDDELNDWVRERGTFENEEDVRRHAENALIYRIATRFKFLYRRKNVFLKSYQIYENEVEKIVTEQKYFRVFDCVMVVITLLFIRGYFSVLEQIIFQAGGK